MNSDYEVLCQFQFVCAMQWKNFAPIAGDEGKRYCGSCDQNVHLVSSFAELATHAANKHCVSFAVRRKEAPIREIVGLPRSRVQVLDPEGTINPDLLIMIRDMDFSPGIAKKLEARGIRLLGDLIQLQAHELETLFKSSRTNVNEVKEILASRGFFLGENLDDWMNLSKEFRDRL